MHELHPGQAAPDAVAFGRALADAACEGSVSSCGFDDRYFAARAALHQALHAPDMVNVTPEQQVDRALQLMLQYFKDGGWPADEGEEEVHEQGAAACKTPSERTLPNDKRIWQVTEAESAPDLSLPELVAYFRGALNRHRPSSDPWAALIAVGRRINFPLQALASDEQSISLQLWLLASAWLYVIYPGRKAGDCLEFGRAVVEIGYRSPALPGTPDHRFTDACAEVREKLSSPRLGHLQMHVKIDFILEILAHLYDSGARQWKAP